MGKRNDYRIYKKNHYDLPKDVTSMFDLGFLGIEKEFPTEQPSFLPIKKEKDHELTEVQKEILQQKPFCSKKDSYRIHMPST